MNSLLPILPKDSFYVLATHIDPDIDAVSSLLGLQILLEERGYQVKGYLDQVPPYLEFLQGWDRFYAAEKLPLPEVFSLICLDCGSPDRVFPANFLKRARTIINIDHHFNNPLFGTYNICLTDVSSTAEIIYNLAQADKIPMSVPVATNLYAGILFDTGGFRYSNTRPGTFKIADELIALGLNPSQIADRVFSHWSQKGFSALSIALSSAEYWETDKILFSFVPFQKCKEQGLSNVDFEGVIDILRLNRSSIFTVLIREINPGEFKGSVRAKEPFEIQDALEELKGGGHKRAAGFTVKDMDIVTIRGILKENLTKLL